MDVTDSAIWTPTVVVIDDGDACSNAEHMATAQGLANRTEWLRTEMLASAMYSLTGAGLANGDYFSLTQQVSTGGFTLGAGFGPANSSIQVPRVGIYKIDLTVALVSTEVTNPMRCALTLTHATGGTTFAAWRYSADATLAGIISLTFLTNVTDTATQLLGLANHTQAGTVTIASGAPNTTASRLVVSYVGLP